MKSPHFIKLFIVFSLLTGFLPGFGQDFQIGHQSKTYNDPARNNRSIPVEIYYPSNQNGNNVAVAEGLFPVIVFGHGFAMTYSAYTYLWEALVPQGFIMVFPRTEESIFPAPNHLNFGLDMAFLSSKMLDERENPGSQFYGKISPNTAVMGHSMGGGAAFLATANNPDITTLITFAPAETNPSAIAAAALCTLPSLVFAGSNDCVTPPAQNQMPMFEALPDGRKTFISISGGGHCYFADYNFYCSFGENTCSPSPSITRDQQHQITLSLLVPFINFQLKGSCASWQIFDDLLDSSSEITFIKDWPVSPLLQQFVTEPGWSAFSFYLNPVCNSFQNFASSFTDQILYFTDFEEVVFEGGNIPPNFLMDPSKSYLIKLSGAANAGSCGFRRTDKSVALEPGWNILPVISEVGVNPVPLFLPNSGKVDIITEIAGTKIYWPEKKIRTLLLLEPGKAYRIKVNQGFTVTFP
jgi:predicted dienelactone hydrolase